MTADFIRMVVTENKNQPDRRSTRVDAAGSGSSQNVGVEYDKRVPWSFQQMQRDVTDRRGRGRGSSEEESNVCYN